MPFDMHEEKTAFLKRVYAIWLKEADTRFFDLVLIPFKSLKDLETAAKDDEFLIVELEKFYAARKSNPKEDPGPPEE